ncbi:MAG: hypothetical protein JW939_07070 [Candidatus Thermoplasmatota archaeon]|nr:hypothetical protein [Candidatus Thermoplasmatota archaeon]
MRLKLFGPSFILVLLLLSSVVSGEDDFTMEEDSTFQTDMSVYELLNISSDKFLGLGSDQENVTVSIIGGFLTITSTGNWYGAALIDYNYIEDDTLVDKAWTLNVTPVNDAPEIINITLSGDPDNLENPVTYSVSFTDVDGDEVKVSWTLDGEDAGEGDSVTRYIFPDQNNLTVIIDDDNGGTDSMSISIYTVPPEGWGDQPDNTRNRIIFWSIFGSAGLLLLAAIVWVMLSPSEKKEKGEGTTADNGSLGSGQEKSDTVEMT